MSIFENKTRIELQSLIKKFKLIYLPFFIIAVVFVVGYSFVNWFFFVRTNTYPLREELYGFWLPAFLPWIPVIIWIRPKLRLLRLSGFKGHMSFAYQYIAVMAIAAPTIFAQKYIETAFATVANLESINQIEQHKPAKYYTLEKFELDKTNFGVRQAWNTSVNNRYYRVYLYYIIPIIEKKADTAQSKCVAWMGVKYAANIDNWLDMREKDRQFVVFAIRCQNDFYAKDFKSFKYLQRVRDRRDLLAFKQSIRFSPKKSANKKTPVFFAVNEPFENRAGNTLGWILGTFVVGAGTWLLLLVRPKFANGYPHAESYIIDYPKSVVLEAIETFKIANPHHFQPQYLNLTDGRDAKEADEERHHLYFFYPDDFQIVYVWTRSADNFSTEMALVAINDGLVLGNWKNINKDFSLRDNDIQKKKFTNTILNKILEQLEYNRKAS
jgi:hypothetical protein